MKTLTVVIPVFNEQENISDIAMQVLLLYKPLFALEIQLEILFVDNCSTDNSLDEIKLVTEKFKNVNFVSWIRNMGVTDSILNAMSMRDSDCYFVLDCDGQDDPKLISEFCLEWLNGKDFVFGIRSSREEGRLLTFFRKVFKKLAMLLGANAASEVESGFWLITKKVRDDLLANPTTTGYLAGTLSHRGYLSGGIEYKRRARVKGKSNFGIKDYFNYALEGLLGDTLRPLRLSLFLGVAGTLISLVILSIMLFTIVVFGLRVPSGIFSLGIMINLYGVIVLISIGILGEYIGRIFSRTSRLPIAIAKESSFSAE